MIRVRVGSVWAKVGGCWDPNAVGMLIVVIRIDVRVVYRFRMSDNVPGYSGEWSIDEFLSAFKLVRDV
jgi:hypothetical protein